MGTVTARRPYVRRRPVSRICVNINAGNRGRAMVRLTGPGKIREFVIPADGSPDTTISASLFNFDVDGDTVKPQHREWLTEFVVPQLGNAKVTVTLRGESSRSGSDAHDLELSIRRVRNVERILRGAGPVAPRSTPAAQA